MCPNSSCAKRYRDIFMQSLDSRNLNSLCRVHLVQSDSRTSDSLYICHLHMMVCKCLADYVDIAFYLFRGDLLYVRRSSLQDSFSRNLEAFQVIVHLKSSIKYFPNLLVFLGFLFWCFLLSLLLFLFLFLYFLLYFYNNLTYVRFVDEISRTGNNEIHTRRNYPDNHSN